MIDPGAGLAISILNLLWIIGFMRIDRRLKRLEHIVEVLDEERKLKELVEIAKRKE